MINIAGQDDEQDDQFYDRRRPLVGGGFDMGGAGAGGTAPIDIPGMVSDDEEWSPADRSATGALNVSRGTKAADMGSPVAEPASDSASKDGFIGNDENPLDRHGHVIRGAGDTAGSNSTGTLSMAGPNDSQLSTDQKKLADLKAAGSPISRIHNPFLRTMAHIGDIAGTTFLPGYAAAPWTDLKYKSNVRGAEHAVAEDLGEQKEQATTEQERAKAVQERANAEKAIHPPEKVGDTPEEITIHDLMAGDNGNPRINPETKQPYSYLEAYRATKQAAQEVKRPELKEGEMPLGDRIPQLNKMLEGRYQILNPGQALPAQYQIPANATQKDYDRIDKALEAEERSRGTKAQQDQANELRKQTLAIAQQGLQLRTEEAGRKEAAELQKKTAPLQQSIDDAETAHQLAAMAEAGNAEADVDLALSFFKTMRSGGQGIRFTRQEQDLIIGARNLGQDLTAHAQKVVGQGQKFTPDQRSKIVQVIDLHAAAAKKALERIQAGGQEAGGTIHYREGNVDYDIPAEKEADFAAKHPKAVKQ